MHIVADENMPALDRFSSLGTVVRVDGRHLQRSQLADAEVLLVRSVTPVTETLLAGSAVRFVGSATIGTDHIDLDYLTRAEIGFAHAPGCNARAVAEYVLQASLLLCRQQQRALSSLRIGLLGLGNVGSQVATLFSALGASVVACDPPLLRAGYSGAVPLVSLPEVLGCDLISLHVPLTRAGQDATWHLLDQDALAALTQPQMLINTCRGAVIDNSALLQRLQQPQPPAVVLDVWEGEPSLSAALFDRVLSGSPHVAGYSMEGKTAGTGMLLEALCDWLDRPVPDPQVGGEKPLLAQPVLCDEDLLSLLQQAWRLPDDAERLGASLNEARPDLAFDRLRKHYPARHELHYWQHQGEVAAPYQALVDWLFQAP